MRLLITLTAIAACVAQKGSPFRCKDKDPMCSQWQGQGECEKNYAFMIESEPIPLQ